MNETLDPDWNPVSDAVLRDQHTAYDDMRERCPVAYSDALGWSVFRHQDVVRVLNDPGTFSNAVSTHLSVPNGMDPPEHTAYRRIIEAYFRAEQMAAFEPECRQIAAGLVASLLGRRQVELIGEFAQSFAVRTQCAFLGWPPQMHDVLRVWTQKNSAASLTQDRPALVALAEEFTGHVLALLQSRRAAATPAQNDVVASLLQEQVNGRPLHDDEIVSLLRNWTVGEVGTMAASVGIVVGFFCEDIDLQEQLRAWPSLLPGAIEEILRLHGPLVNNRRVTTCLANIGGRRIEAGQRISLNWVAANRDERAFDGANAYQSDQDQSANLLWGAGIHICPGAPLARMEIRLALEELLACTSRISLVPDQPSTWAVYPASGFATLPVALR